MRVKLAATIVGLALAYLAVWFGLAVFAFAECNKADPEPAILSDHLKSGHS